MEDNKKKRSSRKRKFEDTHNNHDTKGTLLLMDTEEEEEGEEGEDDEKVEEFFALIRSTREVRHRLRSSKDQGHQDNRRSTVGVWNPTFRPEDFLDLVHHDRERDRDEVCPGGTSSGQQPTSRIMEVETEKNKLVASSDGGNNNINNNNNINSITNLDLKLSL